MPSFLTPLFHASATTLQLINARTGGVVASELLPAFDSASRRTGLLGRDALAAGCAMVIAPTNAIHTFFMRFPIDVVFVSKDGRVVKVKFGVRPWRIAAAWRAFAVIELAAGDLQRSETACGDRLTIVPSRTAGG